MKEANFKETEIGKIPVDWEYANAGDYIDFITGFPFKSKDFVSSGVKLLRGSNVKRNNIDWSESITQYLPEITFEHNKYILEENDIVISMDGSLVGKSFGQITSKDLPALLVQRVARIRGKNNSTSYLKQYYCSEYFTKHCDNNKTSSAIPHISPKDILEFKILIPTNVKEQEKIAEVLSDTDLWIESTEALLAKKRQIKKGAMQKLLSPKEDWEVRKLGEVAEYRRGSFPQPYGLEKWYDEHNGMPFVQVFDVAKNMKLKSTTKQRISDLAKNYSVFVAKGNLVLTIQGSIGRIALTQYDSYVDRTLLIFTNFKIPMDKVFFMYKVYELFQIEKIKAPGGTIKTITKEELSAFIFHFPKSLKTQQEIAEILSSMDLEIESLENRLQKARQLKQGMMQDLLTGKVRLG